MNKPCCLCRHIVKYILPEKEKMFYLCLMTIGMGDEFDWNYNESTKVFVVNIMFFRKN